MDGWTSRKRVALVGIPDEALDVLNHYTQSSEWEPAVVVSASPEAYAARMAEVLGVPVQEIAHRDQLASCDLVIVGSEAGIDIEEIRAMLEGTPVEVADVDAVSEHLNLHFFDDLSPESGSVEMPEGDIAAALADFRDPFAGDQEQGLEPEYEEDPAVHSTAEETIPPPVAAPRRPTAIPGRFDLSEWFGTGPDGFAGSIPVDGKRAELRSLLEELVRTTGAQTGSIMLPDADGEHMALAAAVGLPAEVVAATRPRIGEGLAGRAHQTGEPAVLAAEVPLFAEAGAVVYRISASVPIARDGRRLGVLSVNVESRNPLREDTLLEAVLPFADWAESAIMDSIDLASLPPAARRDFVLGELDRIMAEDASFPERLTAAADTLRRTVGADYSHVYVIDPLSNRLELVTPRHGVSSTEGRYLSLDRGLYAWVVEQGRVQLLLASDSADGTEHAIACLPIGTGRPYGLVVLEHFSMAPEETRDVHEFLAGMIEHLMEIFEVEQGVESQDVLSGLRLRIADKRDELEVLPAAVRAQSALEFTLQILAASAAIWVERPGARPIIAQPQTREAARIVADAWDRLDTLCAWVTEQGSAAWGGTGQGWDPGAPGGPVPYIGVRDDRGEGVILAFFAAQEAGPSVQLPARILLEGLADICGLIPVEESGEGIPPRYGADDPLASAA